jgi:hypothetical protein
MVNMEDDGLRVFLLLFSIYSSLLTFSQSFENSMSQIYNQWFDKVYDGASDYDDGSPTDEDVQLESASKKRRCASNDSRVKRLKTETVDQSIASRDDESWVDDLFLFEGSALDEETRLKQSSVFRVTPRQDVVGDVLAKLTQDDNDSLMGPITSRVDQPTFFTKEVPPLLNWSDAPYTSCPDVISMTQPLHTKSPPLMAPKKEFSVDMLKNSNEPM